VRPHRFANYKFENPPFLQLAAEILLAPLFGPLHFKKPLAAAALRKGDRVIDFGCGGGIGARAIAAGIGSRGSLCCVDVSGFWLKLCRKRLRRFGNASFFQGDIRSLELPEAAFDLVFVRRVLALIPEKERQAVVDCLAARLCPGGRMLICEKMLPRAGFEANLVRALAAGAGLVESHAARDGAQFTARFDKPEEDPATG
jgi:ubiquinone/menaquinone biosynthesis C-methylase UbiE